MKKTLVKAFVIASFALFAALPVVAQLPDKTIPPKIKNNFNQKLKKITLYYKKPSSVDWEEAIDNYFIPVTARYLRFEIEFYQALPSIRVRLELRQLCQLPILPNIEITREKEFFASNTPLAGAVISAPSGPTKTYQLLITVDPPEGGISHPQKHCFENPDHLGEGPYEASIWLGQGGDASILGADDTLHITYTKAFETKSSLAFNRLQNFLKQFNLRRNRRRNR
jgi:hypothetical protein